MPVFHYVLLALLGSGTGAPAGPNTTLSAEALVQPNGGAISNSVLPVQEKKDDTKKDLKMRTMVSKTRHHRRHNRHTPKKNTEGEKKSG